MYRPVLPSVKEQLPTFDDAMRIRTRRSLRVRDHIIDLNIYNLLLKPAIITVLINYLRYVQCLDFANCK